MWPNEFFPQEMFTNSYWPRGAATPPPGSNTSGIVYHLAYHYGWQTLTALLIGLRWLM